MLLSFGAKNFFCFKEWVVISLAFNSKVPAEISKGMDASLTLCMKGGNASGKTNALKIISFLSSFCADSFGLKPKEEIGIDTFFNNTSPTEFFVEFNIDNVKYLYELILTNEAVISEKIYKKDKRKTLIMSRSKDIIKKNLIVKKKTELLLRSNVSVISTAKQYGITEIEPYYNFFDSISSNVTYSGTRIDYHIKYRSDAEFYHNHQDSLDFTVKNMKKFDTGISDIKIDSYKDKDSDKDVYYPVFIHDTSEKKPRLTYQVESSGTKSLFHLLIDYNITLKEGGVLVLDEFDLTLHPDMLPHLVALFENTETNPLKAQLVFSTHNCDIIDKMGKYKTYLFNREKGECYCYRLDELKDNIIRNDRPITPLYKSGKIGGIPRI